MTVIGAPNKNLARAVPAFCEGIPFFGEEWPGFEAYLRAPAIAPGNTRVAEPSDPVAVYQTLIAADALRYLTLQITAFKSSGHPGGFASVADVIASFFMLGYKNILTEVGHHAPGFYSALFLDRSLEDMGIRTVRELGERFRQRDGLLGHLSGAVPGVLNPAGPLGQGQHFAMAAALLHRSQLFPVTIGDGGLGEPYVMSAMAHFHTAFPEVTNFLPVLVWNGHSQEHHSMVSVTSNEAMTAFWRSHGFARVLLVDAKDFVEVPAGPPKGAGFNGFVDSTRLCATARMKFGKAVLTAVDEAARSALNGSLTALIIKQLKGAGVHARGAKSHALLPGDGPHNPRIAGALRDLAPHPEAWRIIRSNFERAAGGPASKTVVTEFQRPLPKITDLPLVEYPVGGENQVPTTALGHLAAHVGRQDRHFMVTNADGNAASGLANVNQALKIAHPVADPRYHQGPSGRVYEPLSEDACAGLAAGLSLMGARTLWCSYEAFAVNGLPVWQTVTQALAELRRSAPSTTALLTAGALEQGPNGWTHQRPEVENHLAAMIRNGNVYPLFPVDANSIQACYEWALESRNKGIAIISSKSKLPVRTTIDQVRRALLDGAMVLQETPGSKMVVLAVVGDLVLSSVFLAASRLQTLGIGVRIVSVLSPRRLYWPRDVAWEACTQPDGQFLDDAGFERLFGGDALLGVTAGAAGMLEPIMLRSSARRDIVAWKRGDTATSQELMALNDLTSDALGDRVLDLLGQSVTISSKPGPTKDYRA